MGERGRLEALVEGLGGILKPSNRIHGGFLYHHGLPGGDGTPLSYSTILKKRQSAERRKQFENMIRARYSDQNLKPAKLQILVELDRGTPVLETEAAKVWQNYETKQTEIVIRDGLAQLTKTAHGQPLLPAPSQTKPTKPAPSYKESMLAWFEVAKKAAVYLREVKQAQEQSRKNGTRYHQPTWGVWGSLADWWQGTTPKERDS